MKNPSILLNVIFAVLAIYAVYASIDAQHRHEGMAAFVMIVIAAIFVNRVQRRRA